ncbi:MAG: hypothetical protein ABR497_06360 [Kiritimatiellia bacterium]|nr:hypothetical protein [Lentisphaerota bacterium]
MPAKAAAENRVTDSDDVNVAIALQRLPAGSGIADEIAPGMRRQLYPAISQDQGEVRWQQNGPIDLPKRMPAYFVDARNFNGTSACLNGMGDSLLDPVTVGTALKLVWCDHNWLLNFQFFEQISQTNLRKLFDHVVAWIVCVQMFSVQSGLWAIPRFFGGLNIQYPK